MVLVYLLIGILAAILGALPLGASNIAVINTTLKQNAKKAFKIAIAAGVAEVMLSYYALHCNVLVKDFFNNNLWVQIMVAFLLLIAGTYLIFKKQSEKKPKKRNITQSKYATGFFLGILNPPVLIYWVIAFGIINNNDIMLSLQSSLSVLFLFFGGVYIGKLLTLYSYSRFSLLIKSKVQNISLIINKVTGVLLIVIAFAQVVKLYVI
ncbi:LysE family transporter [Flavivirga spongiicola]|uniref:LysE family transporter n=1 Tax=Flavivirga spongiicola TaxID=421621 RepID=A0ABU7XVF4_9FLAO|nr:LysE family transporter [Flavivirga sp. MEBiC05379]MDO5979488.1 LysE family transporter [Flavivirga sp. MEBiC05379]